MAEQDIQAGAGMVQGVSGAITITGLAAGDANYSSMNQTGNFTLDEQANSGGTIIESATATKCYRDLEVNFLAKGTSRSAARTVVNTFMAFTPLKVMTVASHDVSAFNVTGNLMAGMRASVTREGRAEATFTIRQYQDSAGSYGALALVVG